MFNLSFFIAKRLYNDKGSKKPVSKLAVNIATLGVGIGLAVMIVTICIVFGFKSEITNKVIGYGADIEVFSINVANTPDSYPINASEAVCKEFRETPGVKLVQKVSNKFGIIKTDVDYKEIILKGLASNYDIQFIKQWLKDGRVPQLNNKEANEIIISQRMASKLNIHTNDKIFAYFFENTVKVRRFKVVGIFSTDMQQFDDNVVYTNIHAVNQLNNWSEDQCSTLEIKIKDFRNLEDSYTEVLHTMHNLKNADGNEYVAYTIKQLYGQIFDWLQLLDLNIWVILALMTLLACLTMISGLLILILEKTSTIGILKAIGAKGMTIRNIFISYAFFIIGRGIVLGYALGIGLSYLQLECKIFTLNPEKYYVSYVPILFNWPVIAALGVATLFICVLTLIGPSFLITSIRPSKAIKFD